MLEEPKRDLHPDVENLPISQRGATRSDVGFLTRRKRIDRSGQSFGRLAQFYNKYCESLIRRKVYHFISAGTLICTIFLLDLKIVFLLGLLYLVIFRILWKATSFALLAFLILIIVTQSKFITVWAAIVFAAGDGAAAVLGSKYGKTKLPWNQKKTLLGTTTFILSASLALWSFSLAMMPDSGWEKYVFIFIPPLVGSIAECLPDSIINKWGNNDNMIVILSTGMTIYILQIMLNFHPPI